MTTIKPSNAVLLVEGKDDCHVIKNLCISHNLPEVFSVEHASEVGNGEHGGFSWILEDIPIRVKQTGIQTIGVVIDADQQIDNRWNSVCDCFRRAGYQNFPQQPDANGSILHVPDMPKVGVWIMPDNLMRGMLEDFVIELIGDKDNDTLSTMIENHLHHVEAQGLNRYNAALHHSKAFIHSWLACQETPGRPMGQAITCRYLSSDQPIALKFVDWLKHLYNIQES